MDTTVLTTDIQKACNPGFTDFGSGNVITLTSQCLRSARKPTICTICSDFCPVGAIGTEMEGRPRIAQSCIKCGACVGCCPTNALSTSMKTIQQINRLALQATLRVEHLVIGCERTAALLRLEKRTDQPEAALTALSLIEDAAASDHLLTVPCLALLTRDVWFSILNEIGVAQLEELSVFLPIGQCAQCPVNAKDNIEEQFGESIGIAESWSGQQVGIIGDVCDLPQKRVANVRAYLASGQEMDRRGAFTGFLDELKQSWDENANVGNKALDEARFQRMRRESFERTLLSAELKKTTAVGNRPLDVPTHHILVEAIGRNEANAANVLLLMSTTDHSSCDRCGICVQVCPVKARTMESSKAEQPGDTAPVDDTAQPDGAAQLENAQPDGTAPASDAAQPAEAEQLGTAQPDEGKMVMVNELYCIACSACLQACPKAACYFTEVDGMIFLPSD